jgi:hypothetical protein
MFNDISVVVCFNPPVSITVLVGPKLLGTYPADEVFESEDVSSVTDIDSQDELYSFYGWPVYRFYRVDEKVSRLISVPELVLIYCDKLRREKRALEELSLLGDLLACYFFVYGWWRGSVSAIDVARRYAEVEVEMDGPEVSNFDERSLYPYLLPSDFMGRYGRRRGGSGPREPEPVSVVPFCGYVDPILNGGMFAFCATKRIRPDEEDYSYDLEMKLKVGLGYLFFDRSKRDYVKAVELFSAVSESDFQGIGRWNGYPIDDPCAYAQFYLGMMYLLGWGVGQDFSEANFWFSIASTSNLNQKFPHEPRCLIAEGYGSTLECGFPRERYQAFIERMGFDFPPGLAPGGRLA